MAVQNLIINLNMSFQFQYRWQPLSTLMVRLRARKIRSPYWVSFDKCYIRTAFAMTLNSTKDCCIGVHAKHFASMSHPENVVSIDAVRTTIICEWGYIRHKWLRTLVPTVMHAVVVVFFLLRVFQHHEPGIPRHAFLARKLSRDRTWHWPTRIDAWQLQYSCQWFERLEIDWIWHFVPRTKIDWDSTWDRGVASAHNN